MTTQYHTIPYYTTPYHNILHHTTLYHTIPHYTTMYHTIHTIHTIQFLKEDAFEYLSQSKIEEIVKKHSEFITFPIALYKKTTEMVEVPVEVEEGEEKEPTVEDDLEVTEEDDKPKTKTEKVDKWDWEVLNGDVAIWSRDSKEISTEEYQAFYKVISKDVEDAQVGRGIGGIGGIWDMKCIRDTFIHILTFYIHT